MDFLLVTSGIFLAHKTTKKRNGVKGKKENKRQERHGEEKARKKRK